MSAPRSWRRLLARGRGGARAQRSARAGSTTSSARRASRSSSRSRSTRRRARGEALDHVLLVGPPGLGKTSLAHILREELGVGIRSVAGPALERKDIAAILTAARGARRPLRRRDPPAGRAAEEILYPALEDFRLDIVMGQGAGGAHAHARPAALHARRRDDSHRPAHVAAARPLRDDVPARLLRAGRARRDRPPLGADPRRRDRADAAEEIARRVARHAARREPHPPPRPRRRRGAPRGRDHDGDRARGARAARGRRGGPRAARPRAPARDRREVRRRPGRAVDARRRRSARSRTRSSTSTSRTCSSSASSQRTPRGRTITPLGRAHVGGAVADADADSRLF